MAVDPGPTSADPVLLTGALATSGAASADAAKNGTTAMPDMATNAMAQISSTLDSSFPSVAHTEYVFGQNVVAQDDTRK
jgi:hypothetical protein